MEKMQNFTILSNYFLKVDSVAEKDFTSRQHNFPALKLHRTSISSLSKTKITGEPYLNFEYSLELEDKELNIFEKESRDRDCFPSVTSNQI